MKSECAEIFIDDSPREEGSPSGGPSSPFFDKTGKNVNAALLKLLESFFQKERKDERALSAADVTPSRSGGIDSSSEEPRAALWDHPWFHPPKNEDLLQKRLEDSPFIASNSRQSFFHHAELYASKEGPVSEETSFSGYFPSYSVMTSRQLDWYFYWRSNARKRIFIRTDVSYVFLYFYELIHRIGFSSAEDTLDQMLFVWKEARVSSMVFDAYLAVWVRDFILYYGLDLEYYAVVEGVLGESAGRYLYQECILYFLSGEKKSGFLHALESCSDYRVTAGRFYKDGYGPLLEDIICHVFSLWNRKYIEKNQGNLITQLCADLPRRSTIRPFESALFYEQGQMVRTADTRNNSRIIFHFLLRTIECSLIPGLNEVKKVRKFMTGFLRTIESILRDSTDYRWTMQRGRLSKGRIALLERQCAAFYQEYLTEKKQKEKKIFHVDNELLIKLKEDSEQIREHLILRQKEDRVIHGEIDGETDGEVETKAKNASVLSVLESAAFPAAAASVPLACPPPSVPLPAVPAFAPSLFSALTEQFTALQRQTMTVLCRVVSPGTCSEENILGELRRIASSSNTFPDVIMEEINHLSLELIGDCIIDSDGGIPSIYPDYIDEMKEVMSNARK